MQWPHLSVSDQSTQSSDDKQLRPYNLAYELLSLLTSQRVDDTP